MKDTWVEPESGVWEIEGRSPRIEYSLKVMEEVCGAAMGGLQKLSRGGIEVGGVLYGEHLDGVVRIRAWRPILCEHAKGPAFLLSDADQQSLKAMLNRADDKLREMQPLGWFVSHTRTEIALRTEDLEVFDQFFSQPWQVTLVLRPARHRGTDAGFFFRESAGAMRITSSYKTFSVVAFARLSARRQPQTPPALPPARPTAETPALPQVIPGKRSRWIVALWIILGLGLTGGLACLYYFADRTPSLAFRAADNDGQIRVEWDHKSRSVREAERGVLEITDGARKLELPLTPELLRTGSYVYVRKSDDVNLQLTVFRTKKTPLIESSRFLGQPTTRAFAAEISRLVNERNRLRAQNADTFVKLETEKARTKSLQRQMKLLQQQVDALRNLVKNQ